MNDHAFTIDASPTGVGEPARPAEERSILGEETWWLSGHRGGDGPGLHLAESSALESPAFLATLATIATDVAVLPLLIYREERDGSRVEVTDHAVFDLLARSPNGGRSTPFKWRQALMCHALRCGNGYAEIQRRGRGTPFALYLLDPHTTRAKDDGDRPGYEVDGISGGRRWLPAENVLHVSGLGEDGVSGFNFARLLRRSIGLDLAMGSYAEDYFVNNADPGGTLQFPPGMKPKAKQNVLESWEDRNRGYGNRHRTAILEDGVKYDQNESNPDKAQLVEGRRFQINDVIRAWRLPPSKAGDYSQAHLANIEASNLDYLMTTLMGWLVAIEQEFTLKLFSLAEWRSGLYLEHNVAALLRGDILSRYQAYGMALDHGWRNRDEVRREENLNPIGRARGGQTYTVQGAMEPLDQIGGAATPAGPAALPAPEPPGPASPVPAPPKALDAPLNGDQIFSIQRLLNDVAAGDLPAGTVKALIAASLPTMDGDEIEAMLAPLAQFTPRTKGKP